MELGTQTIIAIRRIRSGRDGHGNDTYTEQREPIGGCSFQPAATLGGNADERLVGGDQLSNRWYLFAPAGVDLSHIDAIEVDAVRYELETPAVPWPDIDATVDHVEARLRRVSG